MKNLFRISAIFAGSSLLVACGGGVEIDGSSMGAYERSLQEVAMSLEEGEERQQFSKDIMLIKMNYVREANGDEEMMENMHTEILSMLDGMDAEDVNDLAEDIRDEVGDFVQSK